VLSVLCVCVCVCVSPRTPHLHPDSTVSLPSDACDEDTAVAVETTTKSSEPETNFTGGGGWGGRALWVRPTKVRN
jgi:hypothetical protein